MTASITKSPFSPIRLNDAFVPVVTSWKIFLNSFARCVSSPLYAKNSLRPGIACNEKRSLSQKGSIAGTMRPRRLSPILLMFSRSISPSSATPDPLAAAGEGDIVERRIITDPDSGISALFTTTASGGGTIAGEIAILYGVAKGQDAVVRLVSA